MVIIVVIAILLIMNLVRLAMGVENYSFLSITFNALKGYFRHYLQGKKSKGQRRGTRHKEGILAIIRAVIVETVVMIITMALS